MEINFRCNRNVRKQFFKILEMYNLEQLNFVPNGFSNNIIWNIAHCIATQQILIYTLSGLPTYVPQQFIDTYKNGTKPSENTTKEEIAYIQKMLDKTTTVLEHDFEAKLFKTFQKYTTKSTGFLIENAQQAIEFNNFHEGVHYGIITQIRKFI